MHNIIKWGLAAGCAAGLVACGNKSGSIAPLSEKDIVKSVDKLLPETDGAGYNDELALTILDLNEPGEYVWDSKTGDNGKYEFRGLGFGDEKGGIDRLVLNGVHMRGDAGPYVDSIVIEGLTHTPPGNNWTETLGKGKIVFDDRPALLDGGFSNVLTSVLMDGKGLATIPGAYFDDVVIKPSEDFQIKADFIGWTPGDKPGQISFALQDMDLLNFQPARITLSEDTETEAEVERAPYLKFSAQHVSGKNIGLESLSLAAPFNFNINAMNPFDRSYDSLVIDDLNLIFDGMVADIPEMRSGLTGNPKGRYSQGTEIAEFKLGFEREPNNPELYNIWNIFAGLGQDKWTLSYKSKVDLDIKADLATTDYMDLVIKDGGALSVDYEMGGYFHNQTIMQEVNTQLKDARLSGKAPDIEALRAKMDDAFSKLSLGGMEVVLDDNSLLEKVLAHMAADQDVSLEVARQQAKAYAMLLTLGVSDPYLSSLADDFAQSAQSFVVNGGGLTFTVKPDEGFELGAALTQSRSAEDADTKALFGPLNADFEHIPD